MAEHIEDTAKECIIAELSKKMGMQVDDKWLKQHVVENLCNIAVREGNTALATACSIWLHGA